MKTLLLNCRLIPALSDGFCGLHNLLINDSKIEAILPVTEQPAADLVTDCDNKTLLPGLFDIHMHLNWSYYNGEIRLNDFKLLTESCLSAKRYLDYGITTVRDMGTPKRLSIAVRNAIQAGLFDGPRIVSGGMILRPVCRDETADPNCFLRYVSGVDEVVRACREEIGEGAEFVKLYLPGDPPEMLPEEVEAAVRIAHMRGRKVAAHAHDLSAIQMCLEKGVDTIEHASYIDDESIQALKANPAQKIVPTLAVLSDRIDTPGFTKEMKTTMLAPLLEANAKNITKAYQAGLHLGFGTDTPIEAFGDYAGLEFYMRKTYCQMDNVDMLLQATKYSAEICGLQDITGEIRTGLAADLILVDGHPDEDITVMYRKPDVVYRFGKRVRG